MEIKVHKDYGAFGYRKFREEFKWMEEGMYDSDN